MGKNRNNGFKGGWLKGVTLLFFLLLCAEVFAMGLVRGKCISKGYELSSLAKQIELKKLTLEVTEGERLNYISKDKLFSIAAQKGFVLKQEGKTFNVER
ncbi:MAG: hypothetical protein LBD73_01760 [Deferribacteraceae bacterium]|jgi:hypothetical protein|nr:hypothetical protein [Deferribacteraceae bacterium]